MAKKSKADTKRLFLGLFIAPELWFAVAEKRISAMERDFIAEINSLSGRNKLCYASNKHFSEMMGISKKWASQIINSLVKKGLVEVILYPEKGNKREILLTIECIENLLNRKPYPIEQKPDTPIPQKPDTPIPQKPDTPIPQKPDTYPTKTGYLSHKNRIPIPQKPDSLYIEENTNYNTNENTNKINRKKSSKKLELELEKARVKIAEFELELFSIIPPRTKGQRVTYRRLFDHVAKAISVGELKADIFGKLLESAKTALRDGDNPRAMWMTMAKRLTGFAGQSPAVKKQSFEQNRKKQLEHLGVKK